MTRIILSAYQCGPGMGSVSQIGWEWFHRLSHKQPVTLVTHVRNRVTLEAHADQIHSSAQIEYIDTEWFAGRLYRLAKFLFPKSEHGVFLVASLDFFLFDWLAVKRLKRRMKEGLQAKWVHIVTPVTLAAPSRLHRLGLPVVRGPLNCGLNSPKGFGHLLRHEKEWVNRLRDWTRPLDMLWGSSRNTDLFLVATQATLEKLPKRFRSRAQPVLENGIDTAHFPPAPLPAAPDKRHPLQVLFVGRLIALKGMEILINAVHQAGLAGHRIELTLVGDGPERASLQTQIDRLGLEKQVHLRGALPADEVATALRACHLFCLPSVRESGGAVLMEAMSVGRPVLTVQFGGPGELVDDTVGKALPLSTPAKLVQDLTDALIDCASNYPQWAAKAPACIERARGQFDWVAKIDHTLTLCQQQNPQNGLHLRHNCGTTI